MKTNEEAKQEAIKKAYGEHWDKVKHCIDGDGYFHIDEVEDTGLDYDTLDRKGSSRFRPNSLSGIENNQGWIRIEPDGSNLPTKKGSYKCVKSEDGLIIEMNFYPDDKKWYYGLKLMKPSHYKPIEKELPPIY